MHDLIIGSNGDTRMKIHQGQSIQCCLWKTLVSEVPIGHGYISHHNKESQPIYFTSQQLNRNSPLIPFDLETFEVIALPAMTRKRPVTPASFVH